jgi:hypothetical protein
VPLEVSKALMERVGELHKRGVSLTAPDSLPAEEDLYSMGRGGRFGSRDGDFFERRRMQQGGRGGRGGYGGREGGRGGYGGREGGRSFGGRDSGRSFERRDRDGGRDGGRSFERRDRDGGRDGSRGSYGDRRRTPGGFERSERSFGGSRPGWDLSEDTFGGRSGGKEAW